MSPSRTLSLGIFLRKRDMSFGKSLIQRDSTENTVGKMSITQKDSNLGGQHII
jgi:hypothetical protein